MFLDKLKHSYFACLSILILATCSYVAGRAEASKSASAYSISFDAYGYDSADASYTTFGE